MNWSMLLFVYCNISNNKIDILKKTVEQAEPAHVELISNRLSCSNYCTERAAGKKKCAKMLREYAVNLKQQQHGIHYNILITLRQGSTVFSTRI